MIILGREPLHEGNAYKNKDKGNRGEPIKLLKEGDHDNRGRSGHESTNAIKRVSRAQLRMVIFAPK